MDLWYYPAALSNGFMSVTICYHFSDNAKSKNLNIKKLERNLKFVSLLYQQVLPEIIYVENFSYKFVSFGSTFADNFFCFVSHLIFTNKNR